MKLEISYLRLVSIAALLVTRAQRSTLRHAQQENNELRDDRMGVEPLSTSRRSAHANESALMETGRYSKSHFLMLTSMV